MDQVTIEAVVSAGGLTKGDRVMVAETPMVAGAIESGVFKLLERHVQDAVPTETDETLPTETDETLPTETDETLPTETPRRRG